MKKSYSLFATLILIASSAFSQSVTSETAITHADYIFEGVVVSMYLIKDSNDVYSISYEIQVKKVLKGNNQLREMDTVELVSPMPTGWSVLNNGELATFGSSHPLPLSKQIGFKMGPPMNGLFMAVISEYKSLDSEKKRTILIPYNITSDCFFRIDYSNFYDSNTRTQKKACIITGFCEKYNSKEEFNSYLKSKGLPEI